MTDKHSARAAYFQGAEAALDLHLQATEAGLAKLAGLDGDKLEKLLKSVRKDHEKLVAKIRQRAIKEAGRAA